MATQNSDFNLISEVGSALSDSSMYGEFNDPIMMRTGIDCIDYLNGQIYGLTPDGKKNYQLGIDMGKHVTIIGKSGTGKSTLAYQMAGSIISRYDKATLIVMDYENAFSKKRFCDVTGIDEGWFDNGKILLKNGKIYTETLYNIIFTIQKIKEEHAKSIMIDNQEGFYGKDGKLRKIFPPTVIIVDSIAMMQPKAYSLVENEEMRGQMSATAAAKANTALFKSIAQACNSANITCIFINHINKKLETGPTPTAAAINYLKQDETLPGGNAAQYLTNTLIKIVAKSKLEEDKTYQIKGFETQVELVKSRTAPAGSSIELIYDQREGFDNVLSDFQYLKDSGLVKGAGSSNYLEGLEDVKFRFSDFKKAIAENKVLSDHFHKLVTETLSKIVRESAKSGISPQDSAIASVAMSSDQDIEDDADGDGVISSDGDK